MEKASSRISELNSQISTPIIPEELDPKKHLKEYRDKSTLDAKIIDMVIYGYNSHHRFHLYDIAKENPAVFKHSHLEEQNREEHRYSAFRQLVDFKKGLNFHYEDYQKNPHGPSIIGLSIYQWSPSHCIKFAVHFSLFSKTLINLGTAKHQESIERAMKLQDIGSFALTELGHGSNVQGIQTTATYDPESNEFVIHTPNDLALKWWIGATAQLANFTVVWAQLLVNGKIQGVHAFLVPIRTLNDHQPIAGVVIGDCGSKVGLEGIDNGFLKFTYYRVPYDSLLDKFSQIENGQFKTSIKSASKRFSLQLGSLSGGRVGVSLNSNALAMIGLIIATRYACIRKQFGMPGQPEQSIIEYPLVQHRLMVGLAQFTVSQVAALSLSQLWDNNQENVLDTKNTLINQIHAQSSVLKALVSWQSGKIIQACREILGGHGYSSYNRIGNLYRDNDINITWEGDNNVLLQQTAKFLLDGVRNLMKGKEITYETIKFLTIQPVEGEKWEAKSFRDPAIILAALEWRVNLLLQRSGMQLQENLQNYSDPFAAWNGTQVFYLNSLALAYGDVYQAQEFIVALGKVNHPSTKEFLLNSYELWGLNVIINDLGTFREGDFLDCEQSKAIRDRILELIKVLKEEAIGYYDIIAPPDHIIGSPFGASDGDIYNKYLNAVRSAKDCYSRVSWWSEIHPKETPK